MNRRKTEIKRYPHIIEKEWQFSHCVCKCIHIKSFKDYTANTDVIYSWNLP